MFMLARYENRTEIVDGRPVDVISEVPYDIDDLRSAVIAEVKEIAERKILAILPEWKQRNLTARAVELSAFHAGITPDNYPEPDRSEWMAGQALWNRIKAIRAASDAIEAEINTLQTTGAIFDYAETLEANPLWPE